MSTTSLTSKDHEELLDIIDQIRSQGISHYIDVPQIIVCGDQSSGKSSCLEGLCGLRFPTNDKLCTRFATEYILRRGPEDSISISIVPDATRTDGEKRRLQAFEPPTTSLDDFPTIIAAAADAMGIDKATKSFSTDVLRIEICGSQQPHLTLVDLPGLFHSGNKEQTEADAVSVRALVKSYMRKSRSIILATVSAKNDYANQIVTKYARDFDPEGARTMGIITKPDTLSTGSDSEKQFYELAENKDVHFHLGWHVLRNRDYATRNSSAAERDAAEKEFFSKGVWDSLAKNQTGIETLRSRLSRVLKEQILAELPGLIADVESGVNECKNRLERLGDSRVTLKEQRSYLHSVGQHFSLIITQAVDGKYYDDFFGNPNHINDDHKNLRAVVANTREEFSCSLNRQGHMWEIVKVESEKPSTAVPFKVTREVRIEQIGKLIRRTRGRELPGTFKPETISFLFREQASPWAPMVADYSQKIFDAARRVLLLALEYSTDQTTGEGILHYVINTALESIKQGFDDQVCRMLKQHVSGHPITDNTYFTEHLQELKERHRRQHLAKKIAGYFGVNPSSDTFQTPDRRYIDTKALLDALTNNTKAAMNEYACSEALYIMEAYYKVARNFFVDDFAIHCVEECLMEKLPDIFTPKTVLDMEDEIIQAIAVETAESQLERSSSSKKLEILGNALQILRRLDKHRPAGIPRSQDLSIVPPPGSIDEAESEGDEEELGTDDEIPSEEESYGDKNLPWSHSKKRECKRVDSGWKQTLAVPCEVSEE